MPILGYSTDSTTRDAMSILPPVFWFMTDDSCEYLQLRHVQRVLLN